MVKTINERMWDLNSKVDGKLAEEFEKEFATADWILEEYKTRKSVKILSSLYANENCIEGENDEWFKEVAKDEYEVITEEEVANWEKRVADM